MLIAVFGSFAASVTLLIYGALETVLTISHTATVSVSRENSKQLIVSCIEVVDLFLLATVFYITALGLYELFIDDRIKVPEARNSHHRRPENQTHQRDCSRVECIVSL
jgi:uncharacterized membrane protein YqhA